MIFGGNRCLWATAESRRLMRSSYNRIGCWIVLHQDTTKAGYATAEADTRVDGVLKSTSITQATWRRVRCARLSPTPVMKTKVLR